MIESLQELAHSLSEEFHRLIADESFIMTANEWAHLLARSLYALEKPILPLIDADMVAAVPARVMAAVDARYNDELRLATLAIVAAGIIVSRSGTSDKLSLEEASARMENFFISMNKLVQLTHEKGVSVDMDQDKLH